MSFYPSNLHLCLGAIQYDLPLTSTAMFMTWLRSWTLKCRPQWCRVCEMNWKALELDVGWTYARLSIPSTGVVPYCCGIGPRACGQGWTASASFSSLWSCKNLMASEVPTFFLCQFVFFHFKPLWKKWSLAWMMLLFKPDISRQVAVERYKWLRRYLKHWVFVASWFNSFVYGEKKSVVMAWPILRDSMGYTNSVTKQYLNILSLPSITKNRRQTTPEVEYNNVFQFWSLLFTRPQPMSPRRIIPQPTCLLAAWSQSSSAATRPIMAAINILTAITARQRTAQQQPAVAQGFKAWISSDVFLSADWFSSCPLLRS